MTKKKKIFSIFVWNHNLVKFPRTWHCMKWGNNNNNKKQIDLDVHIMMFVVHAENKKK